MKTCDGVFMGGGVRGIGFTGAIKALNDYGYTFQNVAGTSAGAIIAALLAAGYSGEELEKEMSSLNYKKFKGKDFAGRFGLLGGLINLKTDYGLYNADYFRKWMYDLLEKKGVVKFKDLEYEENGKVMCKLTLTACDVFKRKLLVLPYDLKHYGIDPGEFEVAMAVQMSMSIPLYYRPFRLKDENGQEHWIVDGGVVCNYPIWIMDDGKSKPERPIIGFKFVGSPKSYRMPAKKAKKEQVSKKNRKLGIIDYLIHVIDLVLEAQGLSYDQTAYGDLERTIHIPITVDKKDVGVADFGLKPKVAVQLFDNGYKAAQTFLENWDFEQWIAKYRNN